MIRILLLAALAFAPISGALTLAERLTELEAAPGVLDAIETPGFNGEPDAIFPTYTHERITYIYADSRTGTILVNTIAVIIDPSNDCWYVRRPSVLPPPEVKLMTSRTVSGWGALTLAQQVTAVQNFSNGVYEKANPGSEDIREFSVQAISGDTVKVSGYFDLGTTWEHQTWYVRLIDPNGSVAAGEGPVFYPNVEFQRVTETTPAP